MNITSKTLARWKSLYEHGDKVLIQKETGASRPSITMAFKGTASIKLAEQIESFYQRRELQLKESNLV